MKAKSSPYNIHQSSSSSHLNRRHTPSCCLTRSPNLIFLKSGFLQHSDHLLSASPNCKILDYIRSLTVLFCFVSGRGCQHSSEDLASSSEYILTSLFHGNFHYKVATNVLGLDSVETIPIFSFHLIRSFYNAMVFEN